MSPKKIVILGPESTGKSTLCQQLADHYKTTWVPEYAREYLLKNGTDYSYDDLLTIAQGQYDLQKQYEANCDCNLLIIDTDMHVMKVWCEFVFGKCHNWITDKLKTETHDLYMLCKNDLPWVKDELREYPDLETRDKLYHIYHNMMLSENLPFVVIEGNYEERLKKGIEAIDSPPARKRNTD